MKKFNKCLKNNFFYVLAFLFFLIVNLLTPPIFDDWEISRWLRNNDFLNLFTNGVYYFWLVINGRALTNVIMILFTYFDMLWDVVSAAIFTFIIFFFNKTVKNKNNKFTIPLTFLFLISVSKGIRMETYSYISAHVAFIFGFALTLIFYLLSKKNIKKKNYSKILIVGFSIFSFVIGSWIENLSAGFVVSLFSVNLFYLIKNKKSNSLLLFSLIFASLGLLFLFTSPGMRSVRSFDGRTSGLYETFRLNFPKNISIVLYKNKFIFAALAFLSALVIKTNNVIILKNKLFTNLYLVFLMFIFLVLITCLSAPYAFGSLDLVSLYINNYLLTIRVSMAIFWFGFLISLIFPIYYLKQNREIAFLTYVYAVFSLLPLFFINQTGDRIVAVPVISYAMLAILFCTQVIIKNNQISKILYYLLIFAIFIQTINWLYIYTSINRVQKIRESIIKEAIILQGLNKWDYEKDIITLPKFKNDQVLNDGVSKRGDFHHQPFLKYYYLNENTQLIFE